MIKKYLEFIKESSIEGFDTFGDWVESLYTDEYVRNIVDRYIGDIGSEIRLANAVNLLGEKTIAEIKQQIEEYQEEGIEEKDPLVSASTEIEQLTESEMTMAGKGIFHSFLKALTALGQKERQSFPDECPNDFILFYLFDELDTQAVKQVFARFKSLVPYLEHIDYGKNEVGLYFGIKCDATLEYGTFYDMPVPFGSFKSSQSAIRWLSGIDAKSAFALKKELVNLSYIDIITLGKVKSDMIQYNPGYHEKRLKPELKDRVMSFSYFGLNVKWNGLIIDSNDFNLIKTNFINFILTKKWSNKVLLRINTNGYYINFDIKLK